MLVFLSKFMTFFSGWAKETPMKKSILNMTTVIMVLSGLFFLMPVRSVFGLMLTFDDLANAEHPEIGMPDDYHGFSFKNAVISQDAVSINPCACSDYGRGSDYSDVYISNDPGESMVISRDEGFTWLGAVFTAADFDSGEITIEGYLDGDLLFSSEIILTDLCPYDLKVKWNVDELVIHASGKNLLGRFTVDDFRYSLGCSSLFCDACAGFVPRTNPGGGPSSPPSPPPGPNPPPEPPPAPVPEPGTIILMGVGLVLMGPWKFGRKKA